MSDLYSVSFWVEGVAVPKQSTRFVGGHGKRHAYADPRVTAWEQAVGWAAREKMAGHEPMVGPLSVTMRLYLPDNRRRDIDNLQKGVNDAMRGIVFKDDCQIMHTAVEKRLDRANPRVYVCVTEWAL